jgi:hypothetical protein
MLTYDVACSLNCADPGRGDDGVWESVQAHRKGATQVAPEWIFSFFFESVQAQRKGAPEVAPEWIRVLAFILGCTNSRIIIKTNFKF